MGRRRKAGRSTRTTVALPGTDAGGTAGGDDEQLLVVSPKVAEHAKKAEKETRRAARAERKLAKAERKALVGMTKESGAEDGGTGKGKDTALTAVKVKRYIGVARIVVPVVAPIVYQAVGSARAYWDDQRAHRLGVAPDELSAFSGRGARLHARIHHLALSARDLRNRRSQDPEVRTFVDDAESRMTDLEAAVRAAEQMPAVRRRAAHAAVAAELEHLDTRLLALWGVGADRPAGSGAVGTTGAPGVTPTGSSSHG